MEKKTIQEYLRRRFILLPDPQIKWEDPIMEALSSYNSGPQITFEFLYQLFKARYSDEILHSEAFEVEGP